MPFDGRNKQCDSECLTIFPVPEKLSPASDRATRMRLLRFGARLAEQVHEQAEGASVAFGQLA
jgi:hypothetical protein